MNRAERDDVERAVRRIVDESPFEVHDLRIGQDRSIHLMLDRKEGRLSVDEAARFNHHLRGALASAAIDVDAWTIEIESPGAFRALKTPRHWERSVGERVRIVRRGMLAPQVVTGVIRAADAAGATIATESGGDLLTIPFTDVANARLDPKLPF